MSTSCQLSPRLAVLVSLFFVVVIMAGCSGKTMVVLLPDPDGTTGAVSVSNDSGTVTMNTANQSTSIAGQTSSPTSPRPMQKEEIEAVFSKTLQAEPKPPVHFILYFVSDSNELTAKSVQSISTIMAAIDERKSMDISIVGHTDTVGSDDYNYTLSKKRADAIAQLFVLKGVQKSHISTTSHGEGNLLIHTADNVSEPKNRRVEVVIR